MFELSTVGIRVDQCDGLGLRSVDCSGLGCFKSKAVEASGTVVIEELFVPPSLLRGLDGSVSMFR